MSCRLYVSNTSIFCLGLYEHLFFRLKFYVLKCTKHRLKYPKYPEKKKNFVTEMNFSGRMHTSIELNLAGPGLSTERLTHTYTLFSTSECAMTIWSVSILDSVFRSNVLFFLYARLAYIIWKTNLQTTRARIYFCSMNKVLQGMKVLWRCSKKAKKRNKKSFYRDSEHFYF